MAERLPFWEWYRVIRERKSQGRLRYNRERQEAARRRRERIEACLRESGRQPHERGIQGELARLFGVHPSTICRDFQILGWRSLSRPPRADGSKEQ